MNKNCKHCHQNFDARRRNHLYCTPSCKTLASYKRNNYKYISGHYQKADMLPEKTVDSLMVPFNEIESKLTVLESNKEVINLKAVSNAALGTAAADSISFGIKKLFAPDSLPATKGDIEKLKNELHELKKLLLHSKSIF